MSRTDPARERRWEAAMRAGCRGAAGEAYGSFLRELAGTMRRVVEMRFRDLGLPVDAAEDVVQEVLIAVHARRHRWDENRPLLPWLNAIAAYKATDAARRMGRERRLRVHLPDREWADLLAADPSAAEAAPMELERLVGTLPAGQRAVVHALALDGLSPGEAARRLALSEGALRVAFHRGLKRLRDAARRGGER